MTDTYVITMPKGDAPQPEKATILKDPDAILDYTFDWAPWLDAVGDSISSKTIIVPSGMTSPSSQIVGKTVIVWLAGGTAGQTYQVTCRITTTSTPARTDDRSIYVKIKER